MLNPVITPSRTPVLAAAPDAANLKRGALFAYALTVWPLTTAQLSLPFVAPYYVQTFGLSLSFAGMVLTLGRLIDVGADLGVAWGSDRTRTRFGRRKPWVVAGLLLYVPATLGLFLPVAPVSPLHYVVSVMLFFFAWTMAFIPYLSQGTELSDDYVVKNRINITQSAVMLTALLCAFIAPLVLVDPKAAFVRAAAARLLGNWLPTAARAFLQAPAATGAAYYGRSMLVISVLSLVPLVIALPGYLLKVRERLLAANVGRGSLTAALRNPVFLRFALGYLLIMTGYMGRGGLMPILLAVGLQLPNTYLFFMMLMFASSLAVTPLWARLLRRFERITCIVLAAALEATGLSMLFLIPGHSVALTAVAFVIMGLPGQTLIMVPFLVAADASDYARWRTGADSRAIHISLVSLIVKLGSVYAGASIWLAGVAGLELGQAVQTSRTIWLVKGIGLGVPVLCLIAGSFVVLRFPLDRRRHAAIRARLDRRDAPDATTALSRSR